MSSRRVGSSAAGAGGDGSALVSLVTMLDTYTSGWNSNQSTLNRSPATPEFLATRNNSCVLPGSTTGAVTSVHVCPPPVTGTTAEPSNGPSGAPNRTSTVPPPALLATRNF